MLIEKEIKMKLETIIKYKPTEKPLARILAESISNYLAQQYFTGNNCYVIIIDESNPGANPSVTSQMAADVVITLREMM